jgi:hypothetical protein
MNKALLIALTTAPLMACSLETDDGGESASDLDSTQSALVTPAHIDFDITAVRTFFPVRGAMPVANGAIIDTTYGGVTFSCVSCTSGHVFARLLSSTGNNGVSLIDPAASFLPYFDSRSGAIKAEFTTPRPWVSIDARPVLPPEFVGRPVGMPWIEAYDASGALIAKTLYPIAFGQPGWGTWQTLQVTAPSATIKFVRFSSRWVVNTPAVYGEFDNLRYDLELTPVLIERPATIKLSALP